MLSPLMIALLLARPASALLAPAPPLDLRVQYMYYACAPCTDSYRVESSATKAGRRLVGKDVTVRYHGRPLEETSAFPNGAKPGYAHFRIWGQLQPRSPGEWVFGGRTVLATKVRWLR